VKTPQDKINYLLDRGELYTIYAGAKLERSGERGYIAPPRSKMWRETSPPKSSQIKTII
jgi:hypothetical protein